MLFKRFLAIFYAVAVATAFAPPSLRNAGSSTTRWELDMLKRRELFPLIAGCFGLTIGEKAAVATGSTFFFEEQNFYGEPSQMPTGDRIDLNSAFVSDYKAFIGMFPHAAGKIASNGPYASVQDIYKIPGLTQKDIELFRKYEKYFTVNPPGRAFKERINARVST